MEYLNCPHCGHTAEYHNDTGPKDESFWEWIECTNCTASASLDDWNNRSDLNALYGDK